MKFTSRFLVRVTRLTLSEWICLCPTLSLKTFAPTRAGSIEAMRLKLEDYVNTRGAYYINSIGRSGDGVNCPEGLLDMPFDVWNCKLDKQMCKLQAWIPIGDKGRFVAGCHAPDDRKESIYRIVTEGIYSGAHHKPGRYLCPICQGSPDTRYHYSWELTSLGHFVDLNNRGFRVTLIENSLDTSVISSNLCPDCFVQVISTVEPDLLDEIEKIQISFTNEPSEHAELHAHRESERTHRDFIAACLEAPDNSWHLGLALASLYGQENYTPDVGDALALSKDWLGLSDEEADAICNDDDEAESEKLLKTADSVAWRAGWALLSGGLDELLSRGWRRPK